MATLHVWLRKSPCASNGTHATGWLPLLYAMIHKSHSLANSGCRRSTFSEDGMLEASYEAAVYKIQSIELSIVYTDQKQLMGVSEKALSLPYLKVPEIEPGTSCMQGQWSPTELQSLFSSRIVHSHFLSPTVDSGQTGFTSVTKPTTCTYSWQKVQCAYDGKSCLYCTSFNSLSNLLLYPKKFMTSSAHPRDS